MSRVVTPPKPSTENNPTKAIATIGLCCIQSDGLYGPARWRVRPWHQSSRRDVARLGIIGISTENAMANVPTRVSLAYAAAQGVQKSRGANKKPDADGTDSPSGQVESGNKRQRAEDDQERSADDVAAGHGHRAIAEGRRARDQPDAEHDVGVVAPYPPPKHLSVPGSAPSRLVLSVCNRAVCVVSGGSSVLLFLPEVQATRHQGQADQHPLD